MKKDQKQNNKGLKKALVITSVLFIASSLSFLYLYFFQRELKVFNVSGIDPALAEELTQNIVYTSDQLTESLFFSDSLQAVITVNQKDMIVSESSDKVSFSPKSGSFLFGFLGADLRIIEEDPKEYSSNNLFYNELTLESEKEEDGIGYLLYSYSLSPNLIESLSNITDKEVSSQSYITVMYRTLEDGKVAYLEVRGLNYEKGGSILQEFEGVLKSFSFDINDIKQDITAEMGNGDVSVNYDRSLWNLTNLSNYSLSLNDKVDNNTSILITSLTASGWSAGDDIESYLYGLAETEIGEKEEYHSSKESVFEQIGNYETVEIGEHDFVKITYDITYYNAPTRYIYYYGLLEKKDRVVTIRITSSEAEEKDASVGALLESIKLNDDNETIGSQVLGTASVSINPTTVLGQASTVKIFNSKCVDIQFGHNLTGWRVNGKNYKVCSAGTGSGFLVDNSGHIVTNTHVADPNKLDILLSGKSLDQTFENDFNWDLTNVLYSEYGNNATLLSPEQIYSIYVQLLFTLYSENLITLTENNPIIYVQGNEPFNFDTNTFDLSNSYAHYPASLINSNEISSIMESYLTSDKKMSDVVDLAIIKLDTKYLAPSIPINPSEIVPGQEIFVVGYPSIVEDEQISDLSVVTPSTVTQGTISAIKPSSNGTYQILQIDASISGGNSGGPIISNEGNVIGVSTYGISGDTAGDYNFGIKADSVTNFLTSNNITPVINEERETLENALTDISKSYYSRASEKFIKLTTNEPNLAVVLDPYIELCDVKIAAGEDKSPFLSDQAMLIIAIILSAILLCALAILIVLIVGRRKNNNGGSNDMGNIPTDDTTLNYQS
jgi:S1-C subfamily serine protease